MSYPEVPFSEDLDKFLTADEVLHYVEKYAEMFQLRRFIKVNFTFSGSSLL